VANWQHPAKFSRRQRDGLFLAIKDQDVAGGSFWHIASFRCAAKFGRYWVHSGQNLDLARDDLSANDPERTLAVRCGNGFDARFSPYQSARLSRKDASS
jgi:hypothetical protein